MTESASRWTAFHPDTPPALSEGPGRVVAVLGTTAAMEQGWAPDLAVQLGAAWRALHPRLVVADLGFRDPRLHSAFGVDNDEGVADAVLYGASVRRVARKVDDLFFVPAGTAVADPASLVSSPRWQRLRQGFLDAGVTLVLFAPAEDPAAAHVLDGATDAVVLADANETLPAAVAAVEEVLRGVIGPAVAPDLVDEEPAVLLDVAGAESGEDSGGDLLLELEGEPALGDLGFEEPALEPSASEVMDPGEEELGGDADVAPDELLAGVPTADEILAEAGEAPEPPTPAAVAAKLDRKEPRPSGRRNLLLVLLLLVLVGVAAAWYLGFVTLPIPGLESPGVQDTPAATGPSAAAPAGSPSEASAVRSTSAEAASPPAGFSMQVEAYPDRERAWARVAELAEVAPQVLWTAAPLAVGGTVYHRVLVGPGTDAEAVRALAGSVAGSVGGNPAGWLLRQTPLAFVLGEMADLEAARRRAQAIAAMEIPVYILAQDYSDGSTRYRLYAGAYADESEATYLRTLLEERGLDSATLTSRTGRLPE